MKKSVEKSLLFLLLCALLTTLFPFPVQAAAEDTEPSFELDATAALLVDADYDQVLFEKSAHDKRYPASITKVMTALLTLEAIEDGTLSEDQIITVSSTALAGMTDDASTQNIKAGEQISVKNLLYCLLVPSANEAAGILAEAVSGSIDAFVVRMNERAAELGMTDTHFANPSGLHDDDHYTTAYDIYLMTREAMTHPLFREIVATADYRVPATNLSEERHFYNTNALLSNWKYLGYKYNAAIGVKTGYTEQAGRCLVSAAQEDGRTMIAVVLGCQDQTQADGTVLRTYFSDSKQLLEWGFDNFSRQTLLDPNAVMREVKVTLSDDASYVVAQPTGALEATLPNSFDPADVETAITLKADSIQAPVEKGQVLGSVTVTYNGRDYGTLDLVAVNSVERSQLLYVLFLIGTFTHSIWFFLFVTAVVLLLAFAFYRRAAARRLRARQPGGAIPRYTGRSRRRKK